jgi:GntR family transcriptional regulator
MDYIFVDKTLKVPIYKQISNSITQAIHKGLLNYNDRLPTEKEICRMFSISPTVVKMAYETLISEKMIKRIKGKGTFVTNRYHLHTHLNQFYQFDGQLAESDLNYTYQLIMIDLIVYDIVAYRMLKLDLNEPCYLILRIIKENQNPVLFQKIYLPEKFFPDLNHKFESSDRLFDMIENKYEHRIKHMHNTFNPINATSDEALLLKINTDDAIYFVRSNIVDSKDRIIGYVSNYFPGEFTEFEVMVHAI